MKSAPTEIPSATSPFLEVQARDMPDRRLAAEFFPTATFWNLFTNGHQVLLGTRGSGKTALIRMLTYNCLRLSTSDRAKTFVRRRKFIGFFVPLHLELMTLVARNDEHYENRMGYFKFLFNHIAAEGFIQTLQALLTDLEPNEPQRLSREVAICETLIGLWYGPKSRVRPTFNALKNELAKWAYQIDRWRDDGPDRPDHLPPLCKPCFEPLVAALPEINSLLGIDPQETIWIACVDEAECLKGPFLRCINSFMRTQNRGLVVKLATAPFRYTCETEIPGSPIEPNGNDFRFLVIDMEPESEEFERLCNHLYRKRAKRYEKDVPKDLADFLKDCRTEDSARVRYASQFGETSTEPSKLFSDILNELSPQRAATADRRQNQGLSVRKPYINKFAPVLYLRKLRRANGNGNTNVGWYSGGQICRSVSEGNPRRFLDLMHSLFEASRLVALDSKKQQDVILSFAKTVLEQTDGLPEFGPLVRSIIDSLLCLLAEKVHGVTMKNGGCGFFVSGDLLKNQDIVEALKTAIRFSRIVCDGADGGTITPETPLRVSYTLAALEWLPMREGDRATLSAETLLTQGLHLEPSQTPSLRKSSADQFVKNLYLRLEDATEPLNPLE